MISIISLFIILSLTSCQQPIEKSDEGITEGDASWHEVAVSNLYNGWTNAPWYATCAYRKDGFGVVHLKCRLNGGTLGNIIFYLPAGYMPGNYITIGNTSGNVSIGTNGAVSSSVSPAYLDCNSFYAY